MEDCDLKISKRRRSDSDIFGAKSAPSSAVDNENDEYNEK